MKMKHFHLALEFVGAAAVLYILYHLVTKPGEAAPSSAKASETPSLKGSYSKARRPVKATVVKEPDSVVENDEGESEED
jgi:threonine/homoserine/homoserine lactone efflux protein